METTYYDQATKTQWSGAIVHMLLLQQQPSSNDSSNIVTLEASTAPPCYSRIFLTSLVALYGPVPITSPSIPQDYVAHRTFNVFFGKRADGERCVVVLPERRWRQLWISASCHFKDVIGRFSITWPPGCHPLIVSEICSQRATHGKHLQLRQKGKVQTTSYRFLRTFPAANYSHEAYRKRKCVLVCGGKQSHVPNKGQTILAGHPNSIDS